MIELILTRYYQDKYATMGTLSIGDKVFFTLELPDKGNQRNISCIPEGDYEFKPHGWEINTTLKYTNVWCLQNVPNRSSILIHSGNFPRNTDGCILIGMGAILDKDNHMVTRSREALNQLRAIIGNNGGVIKIRDIKNEN